jgi:hypothetical protein
MKKHMIYSITTPLWGKCEDETHTPKSGNLKSSRTLENSELDCKGQNTLHWSVLYTVGKVSKCKFQKWRCMSHLDNFSISYGQKKGRESNWQFDSRPLKSTRLWCVQVEFSSEFVPIGVWARNYELPKSQESKLG